MSLLSADDAVVGSLAQFGLKAHLSEPGHIARQMLEHLDRFRLRDEKLSALSARATIPMNRSSASIISATGSDWGRAWRDSVRRVA